jgi:hypothetical protein
MEYREVNNQRLSDFFIGKRAVERAGSRAVAVKDPFLYRIVY